MNKSNLIKLMIGIFLFLSLFYYLKPTTDALKDINVKYILISSLFLFLSYSIRGWSLVFLLRSFNYKKTNKKHEISRLFFSSIYGMLLNEISIKGSGDTYKFYVLKKHFSLKTKNSAFIVILDRSLSFFSLIFLIMLGILDNLFWRIIVIVLIGISIILFSFFLKKKKSILLNPFFVILYLFVNIFGFLFEMLALREIFIHALSFNISFQHILMLFGSYVIIGYLSLIPSSLGIKEMVFVIFSRIINESKLVYFNASIVLRISQLLTLLVLILFISIMKAKKNSLIIANNDVQ